MLAASEYPSHLSDAALAARLMEADGGRPASPSYAIIARILKEDRPMTPDDDLTSLIAAMGEEQQTRSGDVTVRVRRNGSGGAGFAFDRDSLRITSLPKDRRYPAMQIADVIVSVNEEPVTNLADYNRLARGNPDFRLGLARSCASISSTPSAPKAKAGPKKSAQPRQRRAHNVQNDEWQAMALDIDNMSYEELLALEERLGDVVQPGLKDAVIDALPTEHVCGGGDECAICLEDVCDGDKLMRLPCNHLFHSSCCRDWLKRQGKCPLCNFELQA